MYDETVTFFLWPRQMDVLGMCRACVGGHVGGGAISLGEL